MPTTARIMAGVPASNNSLYWQIRFLVGDPAAWVEITADDETRSTLILRDIEMHRARQHARADLIACPKDFTPAGGLSGDRETATAQAAAECLRLAGVHQVTADRTLPMIYAHELGKAGITVNCDPQWGVAQRRAKDAQEVQYLREAQQATEDAMRLACEMVARADVADDGTLVRDCQTLTSEIVRGEIDVYLLKRGYSNPECIVACGPQCADCHNRGDGPLRSGESVIIDIFPRNRATLYNGDCTRTVVHGKVSDELAQMHQVVLEAKRAGIAATRAGVTGEEVHKAAIAVIQQHGYHVGLPADNAPDSFCAMPHGTGHGIGLDVHEPPLLDFGGPELVTGDALTIEPGLYSRTAGGVRVEDMVIVTADGCENLNQLHGGLDWN